MFKIKGMILAVAVWSMAATAGTVWAMNLSRTEPMSKPVTESSIRQALGGLSLPFIANEGQTDGQVAFYAPTFAGTVFVTKAGEIVYSLPVHESPPVPNPAEGPARGLLPQSPSLQGGKVAGSAGKGKGDKASTRLIIKEVLVNAVIADIEGEEKAVTKVSYFRGNDPSKWQSSASTYGLVSLGEIYPGVELKLKAHGKNVEKLFYVQPGAEPGQIQISVSGANALRVNECGFAQVVILPGSRYITSGERTHPVRGKHDR